MQDAEKLTTDTDVLWSDEWLANQKPHHDIICDYLQWKLSGKRVLDIGERNPLTHRLEGRNGINIDNTCGDLDSVPPAISVPQLKYDVIICSHVIEHLMNPLALLKLFKILLEDDGVWYIITPIKPYWITPAKCHFHEMNRNNFIKLIGCAGYKITDWYQYSVPIPFRFSLRNWLRRLYKEYSIITLTK